MGRQRLRARVWGRPRGRSGNDDREAPTLHSVREDARVGATLQPLSEERAGVALALLMGEREAFIALCDKRHDEVDVTQIFDWTTGAFGFTCKPTRLDAKPSATRYNQFRMSYNAWVQAWDPAVEPDPRGPDTISNWGGLDESVWGAIFDLYEYGLREELGEDGAGVAALRGKIVWVDDGRRALRFSEHHPVDNLGRDGYRSQANRRVENLFFDEGEEPDMDLAASAPEQSELYLPGRYERRHLGAMGSAKAKDPLCHLTFQVRDCSTGVPLANEPIVVETGTGQQYAGMTDSTGRFHYALVPPDDYRLEIAGTEMFVPALGPSEPERVLAYYPEI